MSSDTSSIGGYVDPNWPAPDREDDAPYIIYGFTPSFALALVGIVLFTIAFVVHAIQVAYHRCWYFVPMVIACLFEIVGYVVRCLSASKFPHINIFELRTDCKCRGRSLQNQLLHSPVLLHHISASSHIGIHLHDPLCTSP